MQVQPINPIYYNYSYKVQKIDPIKGSTQACQPLKPVVTEELKWGESGTDYSIYHSDIKRVSIYEPIPPKINDRAGGIKPEVPLSQSEKDKLGVPQSKYPNDKKEVSFGYSHKLKTLYKKGLLPTVTKGFYGGDLTKTTVTLEHLLPHSKKGATTLGNLVLATAENNFKRSNLPLKQFYNPEAARAYLDQFVGVRVGKFNGDKYIKMIESTIERLLKA